jgi:elongation factor G
MQIPIGVEADHAGVVDLVTLKAVRFEGENGEHVVESEIPAELMDEARAARENMLDAVSLFSDELTEAILEDRVTEDLIRAAVRKGVLSLELCPVFMGSAYKNKGVQLLLDAVTWYLPSPLDIENGAIDLTSEAPITLAADPQKPLVALAFKLDETRYGQLTYLRVYQGAIGKGSTIVNSRTKRRVKVGRLARMHADKMEDITESQAGDIVALFGIDCASGDTFTDESVQIAMSSMHVPAPVVSLAVKPKDSKAQDQMSKALGRFVREDPTFKAGVDDESGETIISGMGELHLDVYLERMRREYAVEVEAGAPQVAYRETISQRAEFDYTHKKQTGGSGQYGRVAGYVEPLPDGSEFEFANEIRGGAIPSEFIPSVEKGIRAAIEKGRLIGFPVIGVRVVINDGAAHAVDSSDMAFQLAGRSAFREVYPRAKPIVLEPVMKLAVEGPNEFQGAYIKSVMQRRGTIIGTTEEGGFSRVEAEVPLAEMFGYATDLRSLSQGKAEFTMEFSRYLPAPSEVQGELVEKYKARAAKAE